MPILHIRDQNGNFVAIPTVKGDAGKSAYEQAVEGGFKGTEEEFIAVLNGLTEQVLITALNLHAGDNTKHITSAERTEWNNKANSSHSHTASDVGLIDSKNNIQIGNSTTVDSLGQNIAIGKEAKATVASVAIGSNATSATSGIAIGNNATNEQGGISIGVNATGSGVTIGLDSNTAGQNSVAIGDRAKCNVNWGIQLGEGTNATMGTFQVWDAVMLDVNNKIPSERLPNPSGSYSGSGTAQNQTIQVGGVGKILMITSSNNDIAFVYSSGAHSFPNNGSDFSIKESNAKFVNGVLTLTNNSYAGVNASGITYYYQVL